MSLSRSLELALILFTMLLCIAPSNAAYAKLEEFTLAELVNESTFIAYGITVKEYGKSDNPVSGYLVKFKPIIVLKNSQDEKVDSISLCNDLNDIESYDLRLFEDPYIVLAKRIGRCFMPVNGHYSTIGAENNLAITFGISDQPEKQELNNFMDKIKALVELENKR